MEKSFTGGIVADLFVSINKEKVKISSEVFSALLKIAPSAREYTGYKKALKEGRITLQGLKEVARHADIPYPLFFAPEDKVNAQIHDYQRNIGEKFPNKTEIVLSNRGMVQLEEIQLILKDLARKQEFLKRHILLNEPDNAYVGLLRKRMRQGVLIDNLAEEFRKHFEFDLEKFRKSSKERALSYICKSAEKKGIFISFSSYNFMPQNLPKEAEFSGICLKDRKFPFVFINTRDGEETPLILETAGRQSFTVISMLVCIGMNLFALSLSKSAQKNTYFRGIFSLTGRVLIPREDLDGLHVQTLEELEIAANHFKVTPSMLLFRLVEEESISKERAKEYRAKLKEKRLIVKQKRSVKPDTGFAKYNGDRFSKEVLGAYRDGKISYESTKNILFRKGKKMDRDLFRVYRARFQT